MALRDYSNEKIQMLRLLSLGQTVAQACKEVGLARRTFYDIKDREPAFAAEVDYAITTSQEDLLGSAEQELRERAFDRNDNKSFTLLMFLLKKLNPEYRENYKTERLIKHEKVTEIEFDSAEIDNALEILTAARSPRSGAARGREGSLSAQTDEEHQVPAQ